MNWIPSNKDFLFLKSESYQHDNSTSRRGNLISSQWTKNNRYKLQVNLVATRKLHTTCRLSKEIILLLQVQNRYVCAGFCLFIYVYDIIIVDAWMKYNIIYCFDLFITEIITVEIISILKHSKPTFIFFVLSSSFYQRTYN